MRVGATAVAKVSRFHIAQQAWRRDYLAAEYAASGYNVSATARQLGLDRPHLVRLLRTYNIPRPSKVCEG